MAGVKHEDAARTIAQAMASSRPAERPAFARELMAHCAASLVIIEGQAAAAEAVYRLGDAVVAGREG